MSRKLALRPACAEDAALLCHWWNDGAQMAHAGFPKGLGTTPQKVALQLAQDTASHRLILMEGKEPIGEAVWRPVHGAAEIRIKICVTAARNRHLGTRFLHKILAMLFRQQGFEQVRLTTSAENSRARHVYEKLGFIQTASFAFQTCQMPQPVQALEYRMTKETYMQLWGQAF